LTSNEHVQVFSHIINANDVNKSVELSTGAFIGGAMSVINMDIRIGSRIIQRGALREGDKLVFCIPQNVTGELLEIYASTLANQGGTILVISGYNGPNECQGKRLL
jgi:hypothetical protein